MRCYHRKILVWRARHQEDSSRQSGQRKRICMTELQQTTYLPAMSITGGKMLKRILVCLDGSKFAEGLLPHAIDRARRFHSKIVLLRVINSNVSASVASMPGMPGQSVSIIMLMRLVASPQKRLPSSRRAGGLRQESVKVTS